MENIAITGISGYLGTRLLSRLEKEDMVNKIIGVDIRPPRISSPKLVFYRQDIGQALDTIFRDNEVTSALHLAFIVNPTRKRQEAERIDIRGLNNFLNACKTSQVRHILYYSSHTVYGAHSDNPLYIDESQSMRPLDGFQYSMDKVQSEKALAEFSRSNPDIGMTILRTTPVIGSQAADSIATVMFKPAVMIGISGYNPLYQFVHENDVAELAAFFLRNKINGIFNVAADGEMYYNEVAKIAGHRMAYIPELLLKTVVRFSWSCHFQNESPPSGLEFIKYPPIVSTSKLKRETGFQFKYTVPEALHSFFDHRQ